MKARNILSKTAVKLTLITSCSVLLVGLGAFSALDAKAAEGENDNINIQKATAVALNDANIKSAQVAKVKGSSEKDDGKLKYEIDFVADGKEYEYEVDSKTGAILDKNVEQVEVKKSTVNKASENPVVFNFEKPTIENELIAGAPNENNSTTITVTKAQAIALNDAKVSGDINVKVNLEKDDGISYYDVEFITGGKEYEYEIDAETGAILDKNIELEEVKASEITNITTESKVTAISIDQAKSIALKDANLADANFLKARLDRDDGVSFYEIEFLSNDYEYEYEIDSTTGAILDKSVDREND